MKKKKKHGKEPRDTPVLVPGVQQAERIKLKKGACRQETYFISFKNSNWKIETKIYEL
jgi:hypothetical protein